VLTTAGQLLLGVTDGEGLFTPDEP
jgi:hypothetical protein